MKNTQAGPAGVGFRVKNIDAVKWTFPFPVKHCRNDPERDGTLHRGVLRVREYWIVDPGNKAVHVYALSDGEYGEAETFVYDDKQHPVAFKGRFFERLIVKLPEVFEDLRG